GARVRLRKLSGWPAPARKHDSLGDLAARRAHAGRARPPRPRLGASRLARRERRAVWRCQPRAPRSSRCDDSGRYLAFRGLAPACGSLLWLDARATVAARLGPGTDSRFGRRAGGGTMAAAGRVRSDVVSRAGLTLRPGDQLLAATVQPAGSCVSLLLSR